MEVVENKRVVREIQWFLKYPRTTSMGSNTRGITEGSQEYIGKRGQ
jgi:hypothetical protein